MSQPQTASRSVQPYCRAHERPTDRQTHHATPCASLRCGLTSGQNNFTKGRLPPTRTNRSIVCSRKTFSLNSLNSERFAQPCCLRVLFLGTRWRRSAIAACSCERRVICCLNIVKMRVLNHWFLVNANVDLPTNYNAYVYIAEVKIFPSVYCANVSAQPLLHRSLLQWFSMGRTTRQKCPFP